MEARHSYGKDLSDKLTTRPFNSIASTADEGLPRPIPIEPGQTAPISVFNWMSLVRATWTFILRPIWWLLFKLPMAFVAAQYTDEAQRARKEEADWYHYKRQQERMLRESGWLK